MTFNPKLRFDHRAFAEEADERFLSTPSIDRIKRPIARGSLVHAFTLPLSLCPTTNRTRHSRPGQFETVKRHIVSLLRVQCGVIRAKRPLPGRPQVLCCRFSSVEPDAYSDWGKMAVDALCVPAGRRKDGLGFLRDDRPADAEVVQWWEPAKAKRGFVYIELRTDETCPE